MNPPSIIPTSRIQKFEKDLKSRVALRFRMEEGAYDQIDELVWDMLRVVAEESANDGGDSKAIQPKEVDSLFSEIKSLPGMDVIQNQRALTHDREYYRLPESSPKRTKVNPLLLSDVYSNAP
ncbi:hypothetical protein WA538_001060, partial [Blastocystis sp. DL]